MPPTSPTWFEQLFGFAEGDYATTQRRFRSEGTTLHSLANGRTFHIGTMEGQPVVMTLSGIGKVAAATTATLLLQEIDVQRIVFTGAAGGLGAGVRVGDVVVARELLQHDMDASPLFPRYEVPLTGRSRFPTDPDLSTALASAALHCLQHAAERIGETHLADFGIDSPLLHEGLVISGDRFVATAAESDTLRAALPDALAVEMEGAALAQVVPKPSRAAPVVRYPRRGSPTGLGFGAGFTAGVTTGGAWGTSSRFPVSRTIVRYHDSVCLGWFTLPSSSRTLPSMYFTRSCSP